MGLAPGRITEQWVSEVEVRFGTCITSRVIGKGLFKMRISREQPKPQILYSQPANDR